MAEKTALATGPISSPLPLVSSPWLDGSLEWREAEGRGVLVSVWEENRGCERHDILSWPQILQNLTLWKKTLPADPFLSRRNLFQGCLRCATHLC